MEYYGTSYWAPTNSLSHHGVLGMKWGVRRYQNADGTLTEAGKKRYGSQDLYDKKTAYKTAYKEYSKSFNKAYNRAFAGYSPIKKHREANDKRWEDAANKAKKAYIAEKEYKKEKALYKSEKFDEGIMASRSKNEQKLKTKLDKKVSSGKMSKADADAKLKDFRDGTAAVKRGQDKYNDIISRYYDAKIMARSDPLYKKTSEYRQAGKDYALQTYLNMSGGQSYSKLYYAFEEATKMLDD